VSMMYAGADSSFRVTIAGRNQFMLDNPRTNQKAARFDTLAVKQYLTYYQSISWEVTAPATKEDSIIHSPPLAVMQVEDVKGKVTTVKLFRRWATENQRKKYGIEYKYDPDR